MDPFPGGQCLEVFPFCGSRAVDESQKVHCVLLHCDSPQRGYQPLRTWLCACTAVPSGRPGHLMGLVARERHECELCPFLSGLWGGGGGRQSPIDLPLEAQKADWRKTQPSDSTGLSRGSPWRRKDKYSASGYEDDEALEKSQRDLLSVVWSLG